MPLNVLCLYLSIVHLEQFAALAISLSGFCCLSIVSINSLSSSVSRRQAPLCNPVSTAWSIFSLWVDHSRLDTLLLVLSPSSWFTAGFPSGFWRKAFATILCANSSFTLPSLLRATLRYPPATERCGVSILPLLKAVFPHLARLIRGSERNRPMLETSYKSSYPAIGAHISSSIVFRTNLQRTKVCT
jgi:hypothetical protein